MNSILAPKLVPMLKTPTLFENTKSAWFALLR